MLNLNDFTAVVFDMDGVLYRGKQRLAGVAELLAFFEQRGVAYACATNNSTLTPQQYEQKLAAMGIAMPAEKVITSSVATRHYLEAQAPRGTRVGMIGMDGLRDALFGDGYFEPDQVAPSYYVVGMNFEAGYADFRQACKAIRAGAAFVGTNADATFPAEDGIIPGAGSLIALLETATEQRALVIGKPQPAMFHAAVAMLGAPPERTLTVGDRLDTDIAGASAAGLATALVMTGVTSPAALAASPLQPDAVYADLPALLAAWRQA
ncbi:HAD-IIA family hydrolase [Chloroflexia bacterium SDU3-3]|nr:HAD-IIA family hydrolase [Chloroflexia bacterium SDU3-3]